MDAHLKALADISMALSRADELLQEQASLSARDQLDRAADGLAALRERWPQMSSAERAIVGRTAGPLRDRLDAGRARLPKLTALTQVVPAPGEEDGDEPLDSADEPGGPPAAA